MSEVFLGQIMLAGFSFAPKGFAQCNGQILPISQNQALFSLLGTIYGGNGQTTFALPNMQSRTPVGFGASADSAWQPTPYLMGETGGVETVTLLQQQLPQHTHLATGTTSSGTVRNPGNALYGTNSANIYGASGGPQVVLSSQTVTPAGNGQPHDNMQPYDVINYCIALSGIYPSRG
ncbi:phage tail protein [Rhizobium rhizogenes]|uniref:phage tail protein n=1 Tax=Rhizobium rhizogenes TaxID=359 RepID=UPI0015747BB0|nr:tail fiber protein [Rhizobium rhizogenes]NTI26449.1 phage tail protein [Rhizobium rhizogenes]NTI65831.1 phage tail protein [Rhizobium rhizogenes]QTG08762.1 phage tail protein [Rhizobium rhizogenes]